jgi:hypothetical protein
MDQIEMQ